MVLAVRTVKSKNVFHGKKIEFAWAFRLTGTGGKLGDP
jgi:hypothetical protein